MSGTSRVILAGLAILLAGTAVFAMTRGDEDPLDGTSWVLSSWSTSSNDPGGVEITAEFADQQISGSAGVNRYTGAYTSTAAGAFTAGEVASTMMAGPEPDMVAEATYLELLGSATGFRIDEDQLTLLDGDGNDVLVFTSAS